jgi:hypothetical protein
LWKKYEARTFKVDSGERAAKYRLSGEKELNYFVFLRKGEEEDEGGGGFGFG